MTKKMDQVRAEIQLRKECQAIANQLMAQNKNKLTDIDPIRSWLDINQRLANTGVPVTNQGSDYNMYNRHNNLSPLCNNLSNSFGQQQAKDAYKMA